MPNISTRSVASNLIQEGVVLPQVTLPLLRSIFRPTRCSGNRKETTTTHAIEIAVMHNHLVALANKKRVIFVLEPLNRFIIKI